MIKNNKNLDFKLIVQFFNHMNINVESINIGFNKEIFLETNFEATILLAVIQDIPFLPDCILDLNSKVIKIKIFPSILNVNHNIY